MILAETFRQLITDRAHWEMELCVEAATTGFGVLVGLAVRPLRRHDRKHHPETPLTPRSSRGKVLS